MESKNLESLTKKEHNIALCIRAGNFLTAYALGILGSYLAYKLDDNPNIVKGALGFFAGVFSGGLVYEKIARRLYPPYDKMIEKELERLL